MYSIVATIIHHTTDENGVSQDLTVQIPTFYLDKHTQGIQNNEHAEEIAKKIILPVTLQYESVTVNVDAEYVGE